MDIEDFLAEASIPVYRKQAEALEYQQKCDSTARLFSFESRHLDGGRRRYICVPLQKFFDFYMQQTSKLHFYEIVQEKRPCRAYFDLEYTKAFNDSLDPVQCHAEFIQLCCDVFKRVLNIQLDETNFLTLNSSTETKYSAHVITHLPGRRLFASHLVLKQFVEQLTTEMIEQGKCLVLKEDEKQTFITDTAVYTKNRNFRLYFSSKRDKDARLEYAEYSKFYGKFIVRKPFDTRIFFDALIVPDKFEECPLIQASDLILPTHVRSFSPVPQNQQTANTQSIKIAATPIPTNKPLNQIQIVSTIPLTNCQTSQQKPKSTSVRDLYKSSGPSPFPELDKWFMSLILDQFPNARIRLWTLSFVEAFGRRQIQYSLINCRYCHNIKREHRRQNVFWIVSMEDFYAVQRCFDVDCRSFTSESYPVPEPVRQSCLPLIDAVFSRYGAIRSDIEIKTENQDPDEKPVEDVDADEIQILAEPPKKTPRISI